MYDYRTPPKKRSSLPSRRSKPLSLAQISSHSRTQRRPTHSASSPVSTSAPLSFLSWIIGLSLLGVVLLIGYLLTFSIILPNLLPVSHDEIVVLTANYPIAKNQPVTLVRFIPQSRQLVVAKGVLPQLGLTDEELSQVLLSWQLGVPVDRWLTSGEAELDSSPVVTIFWELLLDQKANNISVKDRLSWWLLVRSLPQSQITTVSATDQKNWSRAQRSLLEGRDTSQCPVAIVNTTTQKGIATQLSTILEAGGNVVIKVTDTQEIAEQTQIQVDDRATECLLIGQRLVSFITQTGESDTSQRLKTEAGLVAQYRAPIVIRVGKDLLPFFELLKVKYFND